MPHGHRSAKKPAPASDPSLDAEIERSLAGINLQDLDEKAHRAAKGQRAAVKGTVVSVSGGDVFVELGPRAQGVCSIHEFKDAPKPGDVFEFALKGKEEDLLILTRAGGQTTLEAGEELAVGALVKAKVTGQNTGGLECRIGARQAFLPASHVALRHEENLAQFIGQQLTCEVIEINPEKRRVTLSRRAVLQKEADLRRKESLGSITEGQVARGKVTRVESFGAFVDLGGGLEGLVHVSNLAHRRVESAADVLQVGQELEVKVLRIEEGGKRIGLGLKQLQEDPWDAVEQRFAINAIVTGKVVRLMDFGAFVELAPGIEGLLHVSQLLPNQRPRKPKDVVSVGQELGLRVQSIDRAQKRISLTRFDVRGALIGSDDQVEGHVIDRVVEESSRGAAKTNLGGLFKKAIEKRHG